MSAAAQASARLFGAAGLRDWPRQGAESVAAAAKIISDLTAQEVALLVGMARERMSLRPAASAAGSVVTGFTDAGKVLLELAASETVLMANGFKELLGLRPSLAALVDLVPYGLGTLFEMQKRILDSVGKQTREVVDSYMEGEPLMAGTRLAKIAQEGIESFVETQKAFLDQVAEQVTIATEGGKEGRPARRDRSKVLTQLAREGVDKFIEAQKQVLELVIERMEPGNGRARAKAVPRTSLAELTRKSVQNFTTAQKSLLDLALKPIPEPSKAHKTRPVRPRARKRAAAAHAAG
jgi:hypothetical protein